MALAFPPLPLFVSLLAPVPAVPVGSAPVSSVHELRHLPADTNHAAAGVQDCEIEFRYRAVAIDESLGLSVLFVDSDPAGCGVGKKIPLKHEPFGGAQSPEDYSLSRDTIRIEQDGSTSMGFRIVDDAISDEDGEGGKVYFGDLPDGLTAGAVDTMWVKIIDDDQEGKPGPPTNLRAVPGDGRVTLTWLPPEDTGQSAIIRYDYRHAEESDDYRSGWDEAAGGSGARTATVTGLTNGTRYKFHVRAWNSQGQGEPAEARARVGVPPSASIGDATVNEGDGNAVVEVTITPAASATVFVNYTTVNGTATEPLD